jgi:hypothetical protein
MPDTFPLLQNEGKLFYAVSHSSPELKRLCENRLVNNFVKLFKNSLLDYLSNML